MNTAIIGTGNIGSRLASNLASGGENIIFAVYFDAIKALIAQYRSDLAGKIIVDPSNPLAPDGKGGFKKTIPADQSSGQLLAAMIPGDAELVKAFGTLRA